MHPNNLFCGTPAHRREVTVDQIAEEPQDSEIGNGMLSYFKQTISNL
jgi:hypothetical protein